MEPINNPFSINDGVKEFLSFCQSVRSVFIHKFFLLFYLYGFFVCYKQLLYIWQMSSKIFNFIWTIYPIKFSNWIQNRHPSEGNARICLVLISFLFYFSSLLIRTKSMRFLFKSDFYEKHFSGQKLWLLISNCIYVNICVYVHKSLYLKLVSQFTWDCSF